MTDVEYSPDGTYFVVSTTGAYGGSGEQHRHHRLRRRVARFEDNPTAAIAGHLDGVHRW